jgi:hypothetical protein
VSDLKVRCEKCVTAEAITRFKSKIQLQTNYDITVLMSNWKSMRDIGSSAGQFSNQVSSSSFQIVELTQAYLPTNET